jgi:hypothetical protein
MPSLSFLGNATSYLRIPNTSDLNFGTGDFTIEWYQYQTDSNTFPRIFQIGTHTVGAGISIGVSIEGGRFYFWRNTVFTLVKTLLQSEYKNRWVHFAISRASGTTRIFMNGISIFSTSAITNYNSSSDLVIGNQSAPTSNAAFGGYLSYFSWVKNVALYTGNFTVPTNYPILTNAYRLLLKSDSFTGTLGSTTANNLVSTTLIVPPGFPGSPSFIPPTDMKRSLFANNAMVFYTRGSLASGGVGGVGNASIKARKT